MGSGKIVDERAAELGRMLAELGVDLLTGGGRGVMEAVSRAFARTPNRQGMVIGVLPGDGQCGAPAGYPNPWVEIIIRTHLSARGERGGDADSRNHINILSSDVVIALPGGPGTASEVQLAVRYERPVAAFMSSAEELPGLPAEVPIFSTIRDVQTWVRRSVRL